MAEPTSQWTTGTMCKACLICGILLLGTAGCHTIEAIRSLSSPSPVSQLRVRSGEQPRSLRWRADYGHSSYPDNWWVSFFGRTVRHAETWEVPDAPICFRSRTGIQLLVPGVEEVVLEIPAWEWGAVPAPEELSALPTGCSYFLCVERDDPRSSSYASGVRLIPLEEARAEMALPLPIEQPIRDPKRWGWLLAAPPLDVVTIGLGVPAMIAVTLPDAAPLGTLAKP